MLVLQILNLPVVYRAELASHWQLANFLFSLPPPADPASATRRLCKQTASRRRSGASRPPPSATDKEAGRAGSRLPKIQI